MDSDLLDFRGAGYAYPGNARMARRLPGLRGLRGQALEDLTFSVKGGTATALLGGNGSGKSTLLQLCNGLLAPDRGEILWRGAPMDRSRSGLSRLREEVGLLFQDPDDQIFAGTVAEDVAFGPRNRGIPRPQIEERVEEALASTGLQDCGDLPPHLLSHGMRKRVALAGVLAVRPRLLLLDEPTAGLDPESESLLVSALDRLVAAGTAVLLSTHDLELAARLAREAIVLREGRLAARGPLRQILSNEDLLAACRLRGRFGEPSPREAR